MEDRGSLTHRVAALEEENCQIRERLNMLIAYFGLHDPAGLRPTGTVIPLILNGK